MPSIELYDPTAHADGWHHVRAPGGYEWWYFDAEDPTTDTQIVAIFMEGFIFHPGYLRAFAKYERRPTKTTPPMAGDFPCVYLCVYRRGKIWRQFFTQYRPDQFRAARDRCEVEIGPNRLAVNDGRYELTLGGTPWRLTGQGPKRIDGESLAATLTFDGASKSVRSPTSEDHSIKPTPAGSDLDAPRTTNGSDPTGVGSSGDASDVDSVARERPFLSRAMTGATHRWTIAAPSCAVSGSLAIAGETIPFVGRGYHDHNFGTAPIGPGLSRWTWGRAMFDGGRTVTFHHAEPTERTLPAETHLVEATADGLRDHAATNVVADWSQTCRPAMFLTYPATLDFGDVLRLSRPRVVDPSPFYLRLQFEAESFGERSTAFCEIAYPHRLRWPILGRMIEMSFDKRPLRREA